MENTTIVTAKLLSELLKISETQAYRYLRHIKEEYNLKTKPTMAHVKKYFDLSF